MVFCTWCSFGMAFSSISSLPGWLYFCLFVSHFVIQRSRLFMESGYFQGSLYLGTWSLPSLGKMIHVDQKIEIQLSSSNSLGLLTVSLLPELDKIMISPCARGLDRFSVKRQVMLCRRMLMRKERVRYAAAGKASERWFGPQGLWVVRGSLEGTGLRWESFSLCSVVGCSLMLVGIVEGTSLSLGDMELALLTGIAGFLFTSATAG